ncbi:MAG: hypothetical protein FWE44_05580 [Defluviitaleaceae bacterium]|nr:hypothetical protein [Defluviitaleaceae bacterium]
MLKLEYSNSFNLSKRVESKEAILVFGVTVPKVGENLEIDGKETHIVSSIIMTEANLIMLHKQIGMLLEKSS